jgi:hypothetical protein
MCSLRAFAKNVPGLRSEIHEPLSRTEFDGLALSLTESVIRVALEIERRVIAFGEPLGGWPDLSIA